jgi:hypothetical protein
MHPFLSLAADPMVIAITELITRATEEDIDPPGMAAELQLMEDVASKANLYKNFFYRNALAFLNTRKRLARGGLPAELRQRLQRLLEL